MCRRKKFLQLFQQCCVLREYELSYHLPMARNPDRMKNILRILNPTTWSLNPTSGGIYLVAPPSGYSLTPAPPSKSK